MGHLVAIDTGGTFTDFVSYDRASGALRRTKALTTYGNLVDGIVECAASAGVDFHQIDSLKHGTTHVINAFIQRRGAKTALLTTAGFRDVLEMRRCGRPKAFDLHFQPDPPLVPRRLRYEVVERIDGRGTILQPLDRDELTQVAQAARRDGVEAIAVSFLNAYLNPAHEEAAVAILRDLLPEIYVTSGTALSREWFEYERTSTAVANAFVGPSAKAYMAQLITQASALGYRNPVFMMASHGGVMSPAQTVEAPVALIESGPIGGCIGASVYARAMGVDRMIAFDMGGTTAKCALVENGRFEIQSTYFVGGAERGFPIRTNVLDIVEVGAGGGSIASVDETGRLLVGPRSAGADPGPVAFRRGGVEPTVTDANLVLGRIASDAFLGGAMTFDVDGARRAIADRVVTPLGYQEDDLDKVADGILALASLTMAGAIKEITIERGRDVRAYELFVFGGGGPLFGSALARELHIPVVVVPPEPGNFSAVGMLLSDARVDETRTFLKLLDAESLADAAALREQMFARCSEQLCAEFGPAEHSFVSQLEMRYKGQRHTLRIFVDGLALADAIRAQFDAAYRKTYGHSDPAQPAEIVGLHVSVFASTDRPDIEALAQCPDVADVRPRRFRSVYFSDLLARAETPVYGRSDLPRGFAAQGPAIIEEYSATTIIGPQDRFEIGRLGEIRIMCS